MCFRIDPPLLSSVSQKGFWAEVAFAHKLALETRFLGKARCRGAGLVARDGARQGNATNPRRGEVGGGKPRRSTTRPPRPQTALAYLTPPPTRGRGEVPRSRQVTPGGGSWRETPGRPAPAYAAA